MTLNCDVFKENAKTPKKKRLNDSVDSLMEEASDFTFKRRFDSKAVGLPFPEGGVLRQCDVEDVSEETRLTQSQPL